MILKHSTEIDTSASDEAGRLLVRAEGLEISFGGQQVLKGVDLEIHQGEVILLRGENGSGKTTLLNILTGNLEPEAGEIHYSTDETPRSYRFPRRWWNDLNPWDHFRPEFVAKEGVGRTWQDVRLFRSLNLRDNLVVAEPDHPGENPLVSFVSPSLSNSREAELNQAADAMLARVGLVDREESSGDMVSLGQSKRVAIARAVAAGARVLFLDEPLAGLDRQGISDVLSLLESLVRDRGLTLVIVEHVFNQAHLKGLITTDWLLEMGTVHRTGAIGRKAQSPPLIREAETERPGWFLQVAGENAEVIDEPLPRGALLTRIRRADRWVSDAKPVLKVESLIVKRGVRTVIGLDNEGNESGFNLKLFEGEIAILQAPNGWGKSTFFSAICGSIPSKEKEIALNGRSIEKVDTWDRVRVGLTACPSASLLFPSLRVHEVARLACPQKHRLASVPFGKKYSSELSGGERQRTLLKLLLPFGKSPQLVVLDEPFATLDQTAVKKTIAELLNTHRSHALLFLVPSNHSEHS